MSNSDIWGLFYTFEKISTENRVLCLKRTKMEKF